MSKFHRLNTRSAKITGEGVMWVRTRYAEMWSYPQIREGLQQRFGVLLSIQQITRIAKGYSFAQLPTVPTEREVDLTLHENALRSQGMPGPTPEEIAASKAKVQSFLAEEEQPRESVKDVLSGKSDPFAQFGGYKAAGAGAGAATEAPQRTVPTLEEIEARERAAMGVGEGAGLDKLSQLTQPKVTRAEKLLETLKDEQAPKGE